MVDQTYSPNKTVTLKDEDLNTKDSVPNSIIEPYPASKTVSLENEKAIVNKEIPLIGKIQLPDQSQPAVNEKKAEFYPFHKTVDITDAEINAEEGLSTEKKEIPQPLASININLNQSIVGSVNAETSYPAHKTINVSEEKLVVNQDLPIVNQEEKPTNTSQNSIHQAINFARTQSNYPQHKTVDLTVNTDFSEKSVVKSQESIVLPNNMPFVNAESGSGASYPAHKTVSLQVDAMTSAVEKTPETTVIIGNRNETLTDKPKLQNYADAKLGDLMDYPNNRTVVLPIEETQSLKDNTANNSQAIKRQEIISEKREGSSSYPVAKTAILHEEQHTFVNEQKQVSSIAPVSTESTITQSTGITKAKKPVLWIIASSLLLLTSAATAWYFYQKQQLLKEEITVLKQNNLDLTESVQRMQKDLHFDDIIARAGKLDANGNIILQNDASTAEVVRTCFSIADNPKALNGKKIVFIRLLDAGNKVLQTTTDNVFEYRGNKIPYSVKEEINYKKAEMMLCVDFKLNAKLPKGNYKAEIYNEGVLDGTVPFELK